MNLVALLEEYWARVLAAQARLVDGHEQGDSILPQGCESLRGMAAEFVSRAAKECSECFEDYADEQDYDNDQSQRDGGGGVRVTRG